MLFETVSLSRYIIASLVTFGLIGALACAVVLANRHRQTGNILGNFKPNKRRLKVIESLTLSGKHKLMLVQQDDIEHTILIGGMTDVHLGTAPAQNTAAMAETETEQAPTHKSAGTIGFLKTLPNSEKKPKPKAAKKKKK